MARTYIEPLRYIAVGGRDGILIVMDYDSRLPSWWPIYWNRGPWQWGWMGNGWNCLMLGKIRIYF